MGLLGFIIQCPYFQGSTIRGSTVLCSGISNVMDALYTIWQPPHYCNLRVIQCMYKVSTIIIITDATTVHITQHIHISPFAETETSYFSIDGKPN